MRQLDDVVVTNRLSFAWKRRYPKREESSQHSAQSRGSVPQKWKKVQHLRLIVAHLNIYHREKRTTYQDKNFYALVLKTLKIKKAQFIGRPLVIYWQLLNSYRFK